MKPAPMWLALLVLVLAACQVEGLSFTLEERVRIESPQSGEHLGVPFELTWAIEDPELAADVAGGQAQFLVIFDRSPMPPGRGLEALADEECRRRSGCPDADWLRDRQMFLTTETSLEILALPDLRASRADHIRDVHEITIVFLDEEGFRADETAAFVRIFIDRGPATP